jgi:hypothetical protein
MLRSVPFFVPNPPSLAPLAQAWAHHPFVPSLPRPSPSGHPLRAGRARRATRRRAS